MILDNYLSIGHNVTTFDNPMLQMFTGKSYEPKEGTILDTYQILKAQNE